MFFCVEALRTTLSERPIYLFIYVIRMAWAIRLITMGFKNKY